MRRRAKVNVRLSTDLEEVDWGALALLYERAPLGPKRPQKELRTAFQNSTLKVFAFADASVVGAGRALSDGVWRAALYDIAVLPEYQGQGLGSRIVGHLLQKAHVDTVTLYAVPGQERFYERLGFRRMKTALAIMPDPEDRKARGFID